MWDRQNPLFWSLSVARIRQTDVRLSWMLPLLAALLVWQCGWALGLTYFGMVLAAVLLHEFGHVFAARATGGGADEIILTPLGGLAMAQPGPGHLAQFLTAGAGPLVNLALCLVFFPGFYAPNSLWTALNPAQLPIDGLHQESLVVELMLLAFAANWVLLLINMLPVFPFDCGQMTQAALSSRWPPELVFRSMIYVGFATAVALMLGGLLAQWPWLIILGAIVLVMNVIQSTQVGSAEFPDDSFMGYDFSQGYTSLERSTAKSGDKGSSWQQWKARRQAKREEQARERQVQDEAQLDQLLAKVHEQGYDSLTVAEKRLLQRVSSEYRDRSKRQS